MGAAGSTSLGFSSSVSTPWWYSWNPVSYNTPSAPVSTPCTTTSTKASSTTAAATPTPTADKTKFFLKSSCDGSCIGHYGGDGQTFTNAYTQLGGTFDGFYFNATTGQLVDSTVNKFCVSSQAGGSATQFQCSGDLDGPGSDNFGLSNGLITYQGSTTFYGCGTSNLTDPSSTGLSYSVAQGDPQNCKACTFSVVYDASQCDAVRATTVVPPPVITTTPTPTPANPGACPTTHCQLTWNKQTSCYKYCNPWGSWGLHKRTYNAQFCSTGTFCQPYGKAFSWACLPQKTF